MRAHWVRVLLVEDDEDDYLLTRALLEGSVDPLVKLDRVATYAAGLAAVARGEHDLYLVGYRLGERDGVAFVREAHALGCRRPLLLLTGEVDRRVDLAATAAGAAGFLLKHVVTVSSLERAIRYALGHGVGTETRPAPRLTALARPLPRAV